MQLSDYLSKATISIREAAEKIDTNGRQLMLVVDDDEKLIGIVTDGDIRRGMLAGLGLDSPVKAIMGTNPVTVSEECTSQEAEAILHGLVINHIPIVDRAGRVVGIFTRDTIIHDEILPNTAVLMAGGEGVRLRPLTMDCPKPLLKIGGKPILETSIELLRDSGFRKFIITVQYLAEKIVEHFRDGSRWGVSIEYIHETEQLGTAGALRYLTSKLSEPLLVMNGDLLTRVNYKHLLHYHKKHQATATMCVKQVAQQIPFGVVELEGNEVRSIEEKPTSRYFINSGIYVINPEAVQAIPVTSQYHMTTFFGDLKAKGCKTIAYPIREYWQDIGQPEDFDSACKEFGKHFQNVLGRGFDAR